MVEDRKTENKISLQCRRVPKKYEAQFKITSGDLVSIVKIK